MPNCLIRLSLMLLFFAPLTIASAADVVIAGVQLSIPNAFKRTEMQPKDGVVYFARNGDGEAEFKTALPKSRFSASFLKDYFSDDVIAFFAVRVSDRSEKQQVLSADEIQRNINNQLSATWGQYGFTHAGAAPDIQWFVNYGGAFLAVATRIVGNKIVVIESMDRVQFLVSENNFRSAKQNADEYWDFFRAAANADVAEKVLVSARPVS